MRIVDYHPRDAKLLADLWNASDAGWLSGTVHGLPKTAGEARDWDRRLDSFARLMALDGRRPVGFLRMFEWFESPDAAYVQWLSVDPRYHGRGIGRDLLRAAIDRAAARGYPRLDLHTWPGNEKAMPLYKRTGFMWVPGSHAYLQNYIPLLLAYGPAKPFLSRHGWYGSLVRAMEEDFDRARVRGVDAFVYRFRRGRERLDVAIDRGARGPMAFADGRARVESWIPEGSLARGVLGEIRWSVTNRGRRPVDVGIGVRPPHHARVSGPAAFRLRPGQRKEVRGTVVLARGFRDTPDGWARPRIPSVVRVGGLSVPLVAGFRPEDPVEFSWRDPPPMIPGGRGDFVLVARNRSGVALGGELRIAAPRARVRPDRVQLRIPKAGARRIRVRVDDEGRDSRALGIRLRFRGRPSRADKTLWIGCRNPGDAVAYRSGEDLVLEGEGVRLVSYAKGGRASLATPGGTRIARSLFFAAGPPYWPSDMEQRSWRGRIEDDGGPSLVRTIASRRRPGLVVEQRWRLRGDRTIEFRAAVENRGSRAWSLSLSFAGEGPPEHGVVTLPTDRGPVREAMMEAEWPNQRNDVSLADLLAEDWLHVGSDRAGYGVVWDPGPSTRRLRRELSAWLVPWWFTPTVRVPAGSRREFPRTWFVASLDWRDARSLCARLGGKKAAETPSLAGHVILDADPPLVLASPAAEVRLTLRNLRRRPLSGVVKMSPGPRLAVDAAPWRIRDARIGREPRRTVRVRGRSPGPSSLRFILEDVRGRRPWDVPAVATDGRGRLRVRRSADAWVLDNGLLAARAAASHGASLVSLRCARRELLVSSWPKPASLGWFRPWYGGVVPLAFEEDWPGDLYRERFRAEAARRGTWSGVRFLARTGRSDLPKGVDVRVEYLTRPGSPLVAACLGLRHRGEDPLTLHAGFWAFLGLDGEPSCEVEFSRLVPRHWRPAGWPAWSSADDGFAAFRAPGSPRAVAVSAAAPATLEVIDMRAKGRHAAVMQEVRLEPRSSATVLATLAVVRPEEAAGYRVLRALSPAAFEATRRD